MKTAALLWLTLLLAPAPAPAQKVNTDFDESVDSSKYRTYGWRRGRINTKAPALDNSLVEIPNLVLMAAAAGRISLRTLGRHLPRHQAAVRKRVSFHLNHHADGEIQELLHLSLKLGGAVGEDVLPQRPDAER